MGSVGRPRSARRDTELGLLVMVAVITVSAYALMSVGHDAVVPPGIWLFVAETLAVVGIAHAFTRRYAPLANPTLLPLVGLLNGLGFVFIARVRPDLAWQQATWTAVGVAVYGTTLIGLRRPADLDRYRWSFGLLGVALLLLPMVPGLGVSHGSGTTIWVRLPLTGLTFEPVEAAKVALAIFFASYLVERRELLTYGRRVGPITVPEARHLAPVLLAWAVSLLVLLYQSDLGVALLLFLLFLVMVWVATQRSSYLVVGLTLFVLGATVAATQLPKVQDRVTGWLDPQSNPQASCCYQINQYQYLMASGGVAGTGLGLSGPILLPERESDFIFAVIDAELGLPGALVVVTTFVLMVGAGLHIAIGTERPFDKLLATGLTLLLGIQAFLIMGGDTRLLPLTGVALPFVSYGGTSLIFNYLIVAVLVRISDTTARTPVPVRDMIPT